MRGDTAKNLNGLHDFECIWSGIEGRKGSGREGERVRGRERERAATSSQ